MPLHYAHRVSRRVQREDCTRSRFADPRGTGKRAYVHARSLARFVGAVVLLASLVSCNTLDTCPITAHTTRYASHMLQLLVIEVTLAQYPDIDAKSCALFERIVLLTTQDRGIRHFLEG